MEGATHSYSRRAHGPWCFMLELTVNGSSSGIRDLKDLTNALSTVADTQFSEVWLRSPQRGPSLCALKARFSITPARLNPTAF
jgi:hypothetical protein